MISRTIKFVWKNKILEVNNPDPNETLLNFIRSKLKELEPKKVVLKEVVEHAQ